MSSRRIASTASVTRSVSSTKWNARRIARSLTRFLSDGTASISCRDVISDSVFTPIACATAFISAGIAA